MENVVNIAKINNNFRPMYVKEIIFEHTDETHFITVGEILEILETSYGITSCRKTIYDDIEMLINAGFDIEDVNGKNNRHLYHVLSRDFDVAELIVTLGAVESVKTLPSNKNKNLIKKLSRLAGPSADFLLQCVMINEKTKSDNNQVYYIIDTVYHAVTSRKQIAFKYYDNLTSSKEELKKKSTVYQVSPYRITCSNDFFYLLGYSNKHGRIAAFRIDRINGIPSVLDTESIPEPEHLYIEEYIRELSRTKTEPSTEVVLEFDGSVIDSMLNRFGQDMDISYISKTSCRAKVDIRVNNAFFAWVFGFEGKVRIVGSKEIRDQYIRMVSREMARL